MSAKSFYFESKKSEDDDRSSASSIPWNSDAIQQNKNMWDNVERMLSNEEALPDEEPELRQEILDWQSKFPELTKKKANVNWEQIKQSTFNTSSTNISEIPDIDSLSENDDSIDNDNEQFLKRTLETQNQSLKKRRNITTKDEDAHLELADVFGKELHITPLTLRQRKSARLLEQRNFSTTSSISDSPVPVKTSRYKNLSKSVLHGQNTFSGPIYNSSATTSRFHMPPILNVLDSKRQFCAIAGNKSFVQLTQVQQAKSAAVHSRQPPAERQFRVWNKPLAAVSVVNSRFLNNRNAIVLPSLRHQMASTNNSLNQSAGRDNSSRQFNSFSTSNSSISSGDIRGRQRIHCLPNSQTTTTSTSGRSISAVHAPMHIHGTYYHL